MDNKPIINKEKGVTLIIVFFVMIIIIAVVLSVSVLLYGEIKVIRNMSNSVVSFYAADSGVEKVLYYDRKLLYVDAASGKSARGVCAMCNKQICPINATDSSLACNCKPAVYLTDPHGCDPGQCTNCIISFSTVLDSASGISYNVTATVKPDKLNNIDIKAIGSFASEGRSIDVLNGSNDLCVPDWQNCTPNGPCTIDPTTGLSTQPVTGCTDHNNCNYIPPTIGSCSCVYDHSKCGDASNNNTDTVYDVDSCGQYSTSLDCSAQFDGGKQQVCITGQCCTPNKTFVCGPYWPSQNSVFGVDSCGHVNSIATEDCTSRGRTCLNGACIFAGNQCDTGSDCNTSTPSCATDKCYCTSHTCTPYLCKQTSQCGVNGVEAWSGGQLKTFCKTGDTRHTYNKNDVCTYPTTPSACNFSSYATTPSETCATDGLSGLYYCGSNPSYLYQYYYTHTCSDTSPGGVATCVTTPSATTQQSLNCVAQYNSYYSCLNGACVCNANWVPVYGSCVLRTYSYYQNVTYIDSHNCVGASTPNPGPIQKHCSLTNIITSPSAGASWRMGTTHAITWNTAGMNQSQIASGQINLWKGGSSEGTIVNLTPAQVFSGSYSWAIPATTLPALNIYPGIDEYIEFYCFGNGCGSGVASVDSFTNFFTITSP